LTEQLTFLLYLLLGQALLLGVWSLIRRLLGRRDAPSGPSRREQVLFILVILLGQVFILLGWRHLASAWEQADPLFLADLMVTLHFGFVVAVLGALVLILAGWLFNWGWVRNFWFRLAHLTAIEVVAGQAIVGLECPLTTLERELRGGHLFNLEGASAVARFCSNALYFPDPPPAVVLALLVAYSVTALLVLLTWAIAPPRLPGARSAPKSEVRSPKAEVRSSRTVSHSTTSL
jgi:hypothetical protein